MRCVVTAWYQWHQWNVRTFEDPDAAEGFRKDLRNSVKRLRTEVAAATRWREPTVFRNAVASGLGMMDPAVLRLDAKRAYQVCTGLHYCTLPLPDSFDEGNGRTLLMRHATVDPATLNHKGKPHPFAGQRVRPLETYWTPRGFRATVQEFSVPQVYIHRAGESPRLIYHRRTLSVPLESLNLHGERV